MSELQIRKELWTDVEAAGGVLVGPLPESSGTDGRTLDNADSTSLSLPFAEWIQDAAVEGRSVIRVRDPVGVHELRLGTIEEYATPDEAPMLSLEGRSLLLDLARYVICDTTPGGLTQYNLGLERSTPAQFYDTFVEPTLAKYGITWISRGNFDFENRYSFAFERWTLLQLLNELQSRTNGELWLERDGASGYLVHLEIARGSTAKRILLHPRRNLKSTRRTRREDPIITAIRPIGLVPKGGVDGAGINDNALLVSAVAGNDVTLVLPGSGASPVQFVDQYAEIVVDANLTIPACYIEKVDGTRTEVQACTVEGVFTLASATGIAVGQHVAIRADADGTGLTVLVNPAAAQRYGYIEGILEDTTLRGERNWAVGGDLSRWVPTSGDVDVGKNISGTAPNYSVTNMPPSTLFPVGTPVKGAASTVVYLASDATSDGSGNLSFTITPSVSLGLGDVFFFRNGSLPDAGWSRPNSRTVYTYRDTTKVTQITGAVNGAHSATNRIVCDGFTEGDAVFPGDRVTISGVNYTAGAWTKADAGGNLTIVLMDAAISPADGTAVSVTKPQFEQSAHGARAIGIPYYPSVNTDESICRIATGAVKVLFDATNPTLNFSAGLVLFNSIGGTVPQMVPNPSNQLKTPGLLLRDADNADAALEEVFADEIASSAWTQQAFVLSGAYTLTASVSVRMWLQGVYNATGSTGNQNPRGNPFTFFRWISLHLGPDPNPGLVDGSHCGPLITRGLDRLALRSADPKTYTCTFADLRRMGWNPADEELVIGGSIWLKNDELRIDDVVRLVGVTFDSVDPEGQSTCTLDSIPPRLSARLAALRNTRAMYIQVNLTPNADTQDVATVRVQDNNPIDVPDSGRGDGTQSVDDDGVPLTEGPVPLTRYVRRFSL